MNIKEKDNQKDRIDQQEWLILQVSLHIDQLMKEHNVSRVELTKRLRENDGNYVAKLLDGSNITLRQIADVMTALDSSLIINTDDVGFITTI